jgi:hypothetical protein
MEASAATTFQKGSPVEVPSDVIEAAGIADGAPLAIEATADGVLVHLVSEVVHSVDGEGVAYTTDEFFAELNR